MAKKLKNVKCEECGIEFSESDLFDEHVGKAFVQDDKIFCKDCLFMQGGSISTAQTYLSYQNDKGSTKPHDW